MNIFEEHVEDLAEIAQILAFRSQVLLDNKDRAVSKTGNIVDGFYLSWRDSGQDMWIDQERLDKVATPINCATTESVFAHFKQLYPDLVKQLNLRRWEQIDFTNVNQRIIDELIITASSRTFKPCPDCVICKAINVV
jgi:hypothetical protein